MSKAILTIIGLTLFLIFGIGKIIYERNARRDKLKKEAQDDIEKGIETKDPSLVNRGFDRLNRIK